MFLYKTVKEQLIEERKRREASDARLEKSRADVDYIAMMCDVELETEANDEQI